MSEPVEYIGNVFQVGDRVTRTAHMKDIYPATVGRNGTVVSVEHPVGSLQLVRVTFGNGLKEYEPKGGYLFHSGFLRPCTDKETRR